MISDVKPMQALELWRRVLIANLRVTGGDLTSRQLALLLTVYMTPAPRTSRGLADFLGVSPPVVNRAVYRLNKLGVLRRKIDRSDRRRAVVHRTVKGAVFLRDFADLVAATGRALDEREKPAA
jgi:DNA-binding MarR family transcriptional regulator